MNCNSSLQSEGPAILGLRSCKQLDVVRLQCDNINADAATVTGPNKVSFVGISDLNKMFPTRFDAIMGDFKGPHRLVPDPTVMPRVHPNRKYAIHRRLAIKQEISKMETMGMITVDTLVVVHHTAQGAGITYIQSWGSFCNTHDPR